MNKKILFIVNSGKISSNENGGASVYFSHLELLYKAGFEINVLVVLWDKKDIFKDDDYIQIRQFLDSIESYKIIKNKQVKNISRYYKAIFKPEVFEYNFLNYSNKFFLHQYIAEKNIDLVYAEWRWAAIWAVFSNLKVPTIYCHHDWEFKLAKLRKRRGLLEKFHTFQKKRIEYKLVKKATGCISGSITEAKEIEIIAGKKALYLPTTYSKITSNLLPNKEPNIIHLGGMGTTANRLGLERFLDVCWHPIKEEFPSIELKVIGNLNQASSSLLEKLKDININSLGFVKDLSEVMYPQDIHIIPWEYNTGTRTRLPLVLNYEQVLVATKQSVKAFPELQHAKNAIICNDLKEMKREISILLKNKSIIKNISLEGKKTFNLSFTSENQFPKLKKYITQVIKNY